MTTLKSFIIGAAGLLALTGAAAAMPAAPLSNPAAPAAQSDVQQVRWVCGPYGRCVWRPNYYRPYPAYGYGYYGPPRPRFYGPRYYGYGYGYGPRWRRW